MKSSKLTSWAVAYVCILSHIPPGAIFLFAMVSLQNEVFSQAPDPGVGQKSVAEVQALIDAASPGDIITISGTYSGCLSYDPQDPRHDPHQAIVLDKAITLRGNKKARATIFGEEGCWDPTVKISASGARLENIDVRDSNEGISVGGSLNIVQNVTVKNVSSNCVYLGGSNNKVLRSVLANCHPVGLFMRGQNNTLMNNTIGPGGGEALSIGGVGHTVSNNVFLGGSRAVLVEPSGQQIKFANNTFDGFSIGIKGTGAQNLFSRNVFRKHTSSMFEFRGDNNSFLQNVLINATNDCFSCRGEVEMLLQGNNLEIISNRLTNSWGSGIKLQGNHGLLLGNIVQSSQEFGIVVEGQDNVLQNNKSGGVLSSQSNGQCNYLLSAGNINKGQNRVDGQVFKFDSQSVACGDFGGPGGQTHVPLGILSVWLQKKWLQTGFDIVKSHHISTATLKWQVMGTGDFNGDRKADLVWRNSVTGEVFLWLLNSFHILDTHILSKVPLQWEIVGVGDANGDRKADLVWRNRLTGEVSLWLLDSFNIIETRLLATVPTQWEIGGLSDFNDDEKADLIWSNRVTGEVSLWLLDGFNIVETRLLPTIPIQWEIAGVSFDINRFGHSTADLVWRNRVTGEVSLWLLNGFSVIDRQFLPTMPLQWEIVGVGDVNGDRTADLVWRNRVTGEVSLWLRNSIDPIDRHITPLETRTLPTVPIQWEIVGTADLNGDETADILWRNVARVSLKRSEPGQMQ